MTCTDIGQSIHQSIFVPFQGAMSQVGGYIQEGTEALYQGSRFVQGHWEKLNLSIRDWTNEKLPGPIAKITQAFCYSLPLIAINLLTPWYVSVSVSIAFTIFKVAEHLREDPTNFNGKNLIPNALGFSNSITSIYKIALGVITGSSEPIISGTIDAIKATICFFSSGLVVS